MSYKTQQQASLNGSSSSPKPLAGPVGYTLPGVISYLTSEFTNLERYKIVNNIEKSEMKFKIQLLVSEVNSLKFLNNKQALRIRELEEKLQQNQSGEGKTRDTKESSLRLEEIPPVDLQVLRDSRLRLNKAIKDALELLKPPSAGDLLNEFNINDHLDLDKLLDSTDSDTPVEPSKEKDLQLHKESIFSLYTLNSDDISAHLRNSLHHEADVEELAGSALDDAVATQREAAVESGVVGEESETETVIVDEPDVARLLISEDVDVPQALSPVDMSQTVAPTK